METCIMAGSHGTDDPTLALRPFVADKRAQEHACNGMPTLGRKPLSATLLLTLCLWEPLPQSAWADSKDGIFPSADQVGGQVYRDPLAIGTQFPTDFVVYDMAGQPANLSQIVSGKKTVIAFFVVAAPASVLELKKLQDFASEHAPQVQVLNLHADTVHADLTGGGPSKAVEETIRTLAVVRKEHSLRNPMFVAPNDTLSPNGLSNRLGVRGVPTMFILGADGKVQKVFIGPHNWKPGDL